jgi:hypothetical protein
MSSFKVLLPVGTKWDGADFPDGGGSVFGSGNKGQNLWGYSGGASFQTSDPIKDGSEWSITVTIENPDPVYAEQLAFISRYTLADKTNGVFCAMLS